MHPHCDYTFLALHPRMPNVASFFKTKVVSFLIDGTSKKPVQKTERLTCFILGDGKELDK